MKTTKSKLILVLSALLLVVFLTSSFNQYRTPQESKGKYLTMRTLEGGGMSLLTDNKIIIAYEDGKLEEIELAKSKPSNIADNLKKITEQINSLSSRGYELVAMSGTDQWTTTYTFHKR